MKKLKLMLSVGAIFAIVGTSLAFTSPTGGKIFCANAAGIQPPTPSTICNVQVNDVKISSIVTPDQRYCNSVAGSTCNVVRYIIDFG